MLRTGEIANLRVYSAPEVVAHFAGLSYLTSCERLLFETYLKPGTAILDLGVGGGRTTSYLSQLASYYVGVDYSEQMIGVCRNKFPQVQFEVADAADLSRFENGSFDAVVFAFNGLDYLAPERRHQECLQECHRLLKPGGVFIFSSHNPRAVFLAWEWDRERLRRLAAKAASEGGAVFRLLLAGLTFARIGLGLVRSLMAAIPRACRRLPTRAFWRGQGYLLDPSHGGLLTRCAVPGRLIQELTEEFHFRFLRVLPEDYPRKGGLASTRWYYYAFSKP